ncbi:MAG TPA: DUF4230 domain-containing protein [Acidimicrobiia bacterium]
MQSQPQSKSVRNAWVIIGGVFLAVVLGLGAFVVSKIFAIADGIPTPADVAEALAPKPYLEVGPAMVQSVRDMAALTTVEVVEYTIVEKGTDEGWLDWARGDSLRMIAVAGIGAGVDLSGIATSSFEVSEDGLVEITIPRAEIQYVDVDNEATQVLDRDLGIFAKGDPQLESEARRIAETVLLEGAIEKGILDKAEDNATSVLTNFFTSLGYSDVVVVFEN